jgi:hypothetical protein
VTGVQTCALPILLDSGFQRLAKLVKSACSEVDALRDTLLIVRKDFYRKITNKKREYHE